MTQTLDLAAEYNLDSERNVWIRKNLPEFSYSDGDRVEDRIGNLLASASDRSVFSDELKSLQTDWPSTYYFSANRANLLRPLAQTLLKGARVLELGCGMGAVTRYLGETAAQVIAVEGSPRRAGIAALRCAGLENTRILVDEIKSLPDSLGKFDVVTLIGVLEYACRYGGPGAEREVLRLARSFLKPDGFLILAIENKLGLKYLGGVPEDHVPRSWLGVTNGYADTGVKTWSRNELVELLREAGFEHWEQFLALPDYKLPTTVVTPKGLRGDVGLDLGPILNNTRRHFEPLPGFNAGEAWQSVNAAGLVPDLADSLCFVASPDTAASPFATDELVDHYGDLSSLPRKYQKDVQIKSGPEGICVKRKRHEEAGPGATDVFYQIVEDEPYYRGELLFDKIRRAAMRPDWTLEEFFAAFDPWVEALKQDADEDWKCEGRMLDFAPFNIVVREGKLQAFDQEWASRQRLPLIWLLYRGFYNTLLRALPLRKSPRHDIATFSEMFRLFLERLNLPPELPASNDYLWWQETKFLKFIKNNSRYMMPKDLKILYMG